MPQSGSSNLTIMDATVLFSSPAMWLVTAASAVYFFYKYMTSTFNYFEEQGIPGPKPVPIFGNMWGAWKWNVPKYDRELVKKYGKILGSFDGSLPNLWVTDTDLIKAVFVKDFDHFVNRRDFPLRSRVLRKFVTSVRNQEWKDVRSSITPAFTSGKIKQMSAMIKECAERLAVKLSKIAETEGKVDAKAQFSALTMDVIARCAFGMTVDNLGESDDPFMEKARKVFGAPINKTPLGIVPFVLPKLVPLIGERFFSEFEYFINLLENLIVDRSSSTQKYHDFVEMASESIGDFKKQINGKTVPMWNKDEVDEIVIAQSTLFLLAGFDTTGMTLTNTAYLLATNPDIQERLYSEVLAKIEQHGGISHEMVLDFPYLDQVIHEVLRMCPPAARLERECNADYKYKDIRIKKGMLVSVPIFALHYDADYFPNPETFNPDRWSPENKKNTNPYAWMPFGMGPRNCIGMRFAMEELKLVLSIVVKQFRFFPTAETPEKLEFEAGFNPIMQPVHSVVGIARRDA